MKNELIGWPYQDYAHGMAVISAAAESSFGKRSETKLFRLYLDQQYLVQLYREHYFDLTSPV